MTDERWQLSDGREMCAHCHSSSVYTSEEAAALFGQLKSFLAEKLGIRLNIPTGLALVDLDQLHEIIRRQTPVVSRIGREQQQLEPENTLGIYARRGMRRGIYIQTGLPRTVFLQVAAHEFAHAWQGENCPMLSDELLHEGFAEWLAYFVVGVYGLQQSQEKMLSRQDRYGRGLRWALQVEADQGSQAVINACRNIS